MHPLTNKLIDERLAQLFERTYWVWRQTTIPIFSHPPPRVCENARHLMASFTCCNNNAFENVLTWFAGLPIPSYVLKVGILNFLEMRAFMISSEKRGVGSSEFPFLRNNKSLGLTLGCGTCLVIRFPSKFIMGIWDLVVFCGARCLTWQFSMSCFNFKIRASWARIRSSTLIGALRGLPFSSVVSLPKRLFLGATSSSSPVEEEYSSLV